MIGAPSGERTELCSCVHAEANAVANAAEDLHGTAAFCWCGIPCWDCCKLLVNAGVATVYCVNDASYANKGGPDYSFGSRWLLEKAGVEFVMRDKEAYLGV